MLLIRLIPEIISTQVGGNKDFPAHSEPSFTYFWAERKEAGLICILFLIFLCGFEHNFWILSPLSDDEILFHVFYNNFEIGRALKFDVSFFSEDLVHFQWAEGDRTPFPIFPINNGFCGTNLHIL